MVGFFVDFIDIILCWIGIKFKLIYVKDIGEGLCDFVVGKIDMLLIVVVCNG